MGRNPAPGSLESLAPCISNSSLVMSSRAVTCCSSTRTQSNSVLEKSKQRNINNCKESASRSDFQSSSSHVLQTWHEFAGLWDPTLAIHKCGASPDPHDHCMCVTYMLRRLLVQTAITPGLYNSRLSSCVKPHNSSQCSWRGDGEHQEGVGHQGTTTKQRLGWRGGCRRPASTQVGSDMQGQMSGLNQDLGLSLPREHVGMYRIWVTEQMLKIRRKYFENVISSTAFGAHNYVCTNISGVSRIL